MLHLVSTFDLFWCNTTIHTFVIVSELSERYIIANNHQILIEILFRQFSKMGLWSLSQSGHLVDRSISILEVLIKTHLEKLVQSSKPTD